MRIVKDVALSSEDMELLEKVLDLLDEYLNSGVDDIFSEKKELAEDARTALELFYHNC